MDLTGFMEKVLKLKETKRTGWVESGITDPESVADHSFTVSLLSMILSDYQGYDTLKVVRMALIHDLAESMMGDLTPRQKQENHDELESQAMRKILSMLPKKLHQPYNDLWKEYQLGETPESKLVHNTDKLEMLYQTLEYEKTGVKLDQFWDTEIEQEYRKYRPERG